MCSWCNSLSSNSLLAAAEAGQCSQEQKQKQRDADAQHQAQNKVQFPFIHLVSVCKSRVKPSYGKHFHKMLSSQSQNVLEILT